MNEFADAFGLQHMTLFVGKPFSARYSTGSDVIKDQSAKDFMLGVLNSDQIDKYLGSESFVVVNRIENLPPYAQSVKDFLAEVGILSYLLIRFRDKDDKECILIIASVGKFTMWNQTHFKFYRAFTDLLGQYSLSN